MSPAVFSDLRKDSVSGIWDKHVEPFEPGKAGCFLFLLNHSQIYPLSIFIDDFAFAHKFLFLFLLLFLVFT